MKKSLVISIIALLVAVAALVKDYLPCAKKAAEQNNYTSSHNAAYRVYCTQTLQSPEWRL